MSSTTSSFIELIDRVRSGDEQAAAEIVRRYEPEIRREVRVRLTDPTMRRVLDSVDICQSVFGNFFARMALGQFDLQDPRQLVGLLVTMARNRVIYWARKQHARRRSGHLQQDAEWMINPEMEPAAEGFEPSEQVAFAELLVEMRKRLTEKEQAISELRGAGLEWNEIAQRLGDTAEAVRKRLSRAIDRITTDLELDETGS